MAQETRKELDEALRKLGITKPGTTQVVINCNPCNGSVCDWVESVRHK